MEGDSRVRAISAVTKRWYSTVGRIQPSCVCHVIRTCIRPTSSPRGTSACRSVVTAVASRSPFAISQITLLAQYEVVCGIANRDRLATAVVTNLQVEVLLGEG
ncbi:Uncharacterized protein Fot_23898 [Forsythia ovata]|uniref:Uncharacterized protein n=1 Tax=Forsythia ovata TaxID=205694 RepID=A0ABD1U4N1_9LAMI